MTTDNYALSEGMTIVRIDPFYIDEHPRHDAIFGPATVDAGFVDSIRERGVLQPCIITPQDGYEEDDPDRRYWMIAGRRRMAGFMEAFGEPGQRWEAPLPGMDGNGGGLPCYVKEYASEDDLVVDLIVSNKHRIKTEKQLIDEVEVLLGIYGAEASERERAGLKKGKSPLPPTGGSGDKGRTSEVIAEHLGIPVRRVERLITVFSDTHRDAFLEELRRRKAKDAQIAACISSWATIRHHRLNDIYSLSKAETEVQALKVSCYEALGGQRGATKVLSRIKVPPLKWQPTEGLGVKVRDHDIEFQFSFGTVDVAMYDSSKVVISFAGQALVLDEMILRALTGPEAARPQEPVAQRGRPKKVAES